MSTLKKCKIIMLPTDEKTNLLYYERNMKTVLHQKNQHLYILSDEEIKIGDCCYHKVLNAIFQTDRGTDFRFNQTGNALKIIATTDKSLSLPQPSESFIQKFIEEYNKGNIITNVMVEYDSNLNGRGEFEMNLLNKSNSPYPKDIDIWYDLKLKVSKDNTITIRRIKDTWTREEVIDLIYKFRNNLSQSFPLSKDAIENWLLSQ